MQFLKALVRNIIVLLVIGLGLFLLFPEIIGQVFQIYGAASGIATG